MQYMKIITNPKIIQLHTKDGIFAVDIDNISLSDKGKFNLSDNDIAELNTKTLEERITELENRIEILEGK